MTFSHANCTHPATSSDRAKCRRGTTERPAFPTPGPTTNGATESLRARIKASRATKASPRTDTAAGLTSHQGCTCRYEDGVQVKFCGHGNCPACRPA